MQKRDQVWRRELSAAGALTALAMLLAACGTSGLAPVVTGNSQIQTAPTQIIVQQGQTLSGIAHTHHIPMAMLADANHLAPPYRIRVGQALIAPTAGASSPSGPVVAMAEPTSPPPPGPALQPMTAPPVPPAPVSVQPLPPERSAPVSTQPLAQPLDHTSPAQVAKPPPTTPPLPLTPPAPALSKANPAQAAAPTGPTKPSANAPAGSATSGAIESKSGAMASAPIPPLAAPGASKPPSGSTAAPGPMAAAEPPPAASHGGSFLWPVRGHVVEGFGTGPEGTHNDGINIAAPRGAAIEATDGGVVAYTGNELRGYGNLILIKHPQGWISAYAHCDLILVKPGQKVARGQVIARVGSTGNVSEPQLHFELRRGKKPVDPREYLVPLSTAASKDGHSS